MCQLRNFNFIRNIKDKYIYIYILYIYIDINTCVKSPLDLRGMVMESHNFVCISQRSCTITYDLSNIYKLQKMCTSTNLHGLHEKNELSFSMNTWHGWCLEIKLIYFEELYKVVVKHISVSGLMRFTIYWMTATYRCTSTSLWPCDNDNLLSCMSSRKKIIRVKLKELFLLSPYK